MILDHDQEYYHHDSHKSISNIWPRKSLCIQAFWILPFPVKKSCKSGIHFLYAQQVIFLSRLYLMIQLRHGSICEIGSWRLLSGIYTERNQSELTIPYIYIYIYIYYLVRFSICQFPKTVFPWKYIYMYAPGIQHQTQTCSTLMVSMQAVNEWFGIEQQQFCLWHKYLMVYSVFYSWNYM